LYLQKFFGEDCFVLVVIIIKLFSVKTISSLVTTIIVAKLISETRGASFSFRNSFSVSVYISSKNKYFLQS